MSSPDEYLRDLPKVDTNSEIERNAIDALRRRLPNDQFCFRPEPNPDLGVDGSIEVISSGQATNFRAQVQLKGTRSLQKQKSGSYALQIDVTNFNYLLNHPLSIYFLYIEPEDEMRFVWAVDELIRFEEEQKSWRNQEQVTLHFSKVMNETALDELRQRITAQSSSQRHINEHVFLNKEPSVILEIDPDTFEVTDIVAIKELLLSKGLFLCVAGYSKNVLAKIALFGPSVRTNPRIQLVEAAAQFERGNYQRAKETLVLIDPGSDQLTEDDKLVHKFLKLHCQFETGRIDHRTFVDALRELAPLSRPTIPYQFRYSYLKNAINGEDDVAARRKLFEELKKEVEAGYNQGAAESVKRRNALILLDLEGHLIELEHSKAMQRQLLRKALGARFDFEPVIQNYNSAILQWESSINNLARESADSILTADVICIKTSVLLLQAGITDLVNKYVPIFSARPEIFAELERQLHDAVKTYETFGLISGSLNAKSKLAELFRVRGLEEIAESIGSDVVDLSDDLNYANIKANAEAPYVKQVKEMLREEEDRDERNARLDEATIELYAKQRVEALDLPIERLDNVRLALECTREEAVERLRWCKHYEIIEDNRHMISLFSMYRVSPPRSGHCCLHGYLSNIERSDWRRVTSEFKTKYCINCPDREPKQS